MPMFTTLRIGLPVKPSQDARADLVGERSHPAEDVVHVGGHVHAVDHQLGTRGQAQGRVQHGPVLGVVDVDAAEHGLAAPGQIPLLGQGDQQVDGLGWSPAAWRSPGASRRRPR